MAQTEYVGEVVERSEYAPPKRPKMKSNRHYYEPGETNVDGITYEDWLIRLGELSPLHRGYTVAEATTPERAQAWIDGISPLEWHTKLLGNRNPEGLSTGAMVGIAAAVAVGAYFFFRKTPEAQAAVPPVVVVTPPAQQPPPPAAQTKAQTAIMVVQAPPGSPQFGPGIAPEIPKSNAAGVTNELFASYQARNTAVSPLITYANFGIFNTIGDFATQWALAKQLDKTDPTAKLILAVNSDNVIIDYSTVPPTA